MPAPDPVVLRQRVDGATELRVNGVFVMDDVETSSERALADSARAAGARRILVGGLGLGFTVRALLAAACTERVIVAELHGEIAEWMRAGVIPGADLLVDPRIVLHIGDVQDITADLNPGGLDAILLDVDNGPDFLVHDSNAAVYESPFIQSCATRLTPTGLVALWSQQDSATLRATLAEHFYQVDAERFPVMLQERDEFYWLLRGANPKLSR